jgi:hypothetical protein
MRKRSIELVVAPERALGHVHDQLKRAVDACGDHPVFIVTPWPRFARTPCCSDVGHVTNFNNADFLSTILGDLNKHKAALRKALPSATILDGLELISGAGYDAEKAAAVISSGWAFDPVHPTKHVYAKMALNLLEKVAPHNMDGGQSGQEEDVECQQPGRQRQRPQRSVQRGPVQLQQRKHRRTADSQKPAVEGGRLPGQLPVNPLWRLHQRIRRRRHIRPPLQRREAGEGRRRRRFRLRLSQKIRRLRPWRPWRPRRRPRWRIRGQILNPDHGPVTVFPVASIFHP